ncbi:MAG: heavy metal-associated domain-containing protein [Clostridium celatum]|nr:heavy-metal-associated domain-containing protein [Clostridium celatum]MDU2121428.1 heavy metal-associated domain-containing protein [Clostridium celatum]MDU4977932.1 heavy metal-associated domain-containing protein [Clostridium celatum]
MKKKILIEGMSCKNCVAHVTEALEELNDAKGIEVNLEGKYVVVETNESDDLIIEKIEDMGYDVVKIENI